MTRQEFIKLCGILGICTPLNPSLTFGKTDNNQANKKVIVIGAGAGGLSAGYLLQQQGIDFEILEASSTHGGRIKINTEFADFPIPLGAEWIETKTGIFSEIINDSSVQPNIKTVADFPDRKFVNYSWFNFFEEYILPSITTKVSYNTIVQSIDYSGDQVVIKTQNKEYKADQVVLSVPLKILQEGAITFSPSLPQPKRQIINDMLIWDGFKAFFEFSTQFYDDEYRVKGFPKKDGQKIFYNAAHGQNTDKHILGLFVVGKPAQDYLSLSDDEVKSVILKELDDIYSNKATPNYVKHIHQNWNKEPFIKSGYLTNYANWKQVRELSRSVADKLYFAGGAYTDGSDWVSVHTAARSAKKAIEEITANENK